MKEFIKDIKENYQMLVPAVIVLAYIVIVIIIGASSTFNI